MDDMLDILATDGWSKELLYQLVESVKEYAIFVSDLEGEIVSWNLGAEKVFGYSSKEAVGKNARMLFTREDREHRVPEEEMRTAIADGSAEDERWHVRKDGSLFFASGMQTPLFDEEGKHTGYAKIARDLTERVRANELLQQANEELESKVTERTSELSNANEQLRDEIAERKKLENVRGLLIHKIVKTQEDERKRISREIHDHIGQGMTGLSLKLHNLLEKYNSDPHLSKDLKDLQFMAHQVDSQVDFLAWELRLRLLDDQGLGAPSNSL